MLPFTQCGDTPHGTADPITRPSGPRPRFRRRPLSVCLALALLPASSALAESEDDNLVLDTIEVTGQKLSRDLQETLDSVSVIGGEELEDFGIADLRDAFRLAPNILYSPSNNGNNGISIRGINSEGVGGASGNQQPLASLIIDGAPQSLEGVRKGARGVWDLESIEILRGPQISQGRNALAGAVIVNSRDPIPIVESSARVIFDSHGTERAIMFNTPLTDELSFRITAEDHSKELGIDYSDTQLEFLDEEDFRSYRGKLLYEPFNMPGFTAKLTFARAHDDPSISAVSGDFFDRRLDRVFDGVEQRVNDVDNYALDLSYEANPSLIFTSTSTFTRTDTEFRTPSPNFNREETRQDRDFTQELRANYASDDGSLSFVVGGFFGRFENNRDSFVERLYQPQIATITGTTTVAANACINIDMAADGDGRWFEHVSDAFGQIDRGSPNPDGFFLTSLLPSFSPLGTGVDIFPFEGNWLDPGHVLLDASTLTGIGNEIMPLTSGVFDFSTYIADDDALFNQTYTTSIIAGTGGTVSYLNGTPTGIDASVNIAFTYPAFSVTEIGTLELKSDNTFTLLVGDPGAPSSVRYAWDFSGTYNIDLVQACTPPPGGTINNDIVTVTPGTPIWQTVQDLKSNTKRHNYALYGEMEWEFTDNWRMVTGLRYDTEKAAFRRTDRRSGEIAEDDTRFDVLLPKLGFAYDVSPRHTVGIVATRGYRSGYIDYNNQTKQLTPVDPEYLWAYELSLRSLWFDGKVRTNANVYYYDWTDQQITVEDPNNPLNATVANAGRSEAYGAEISVNARPTADLTIDASIGLQKTRFIEFETDIADYSGNEFPEAPALSASLGFTHTLPDGWFVGGDVSYRDETFATADLSNNEDLTIPSRTLLNLRAGYADPSRRWRILAAVDNVLDKDYLVGRDLLSGAYVGGERVFSVTAQIDF